MNEVCGELEKKAYPYFYSQRTTLLKNKKLLDLGTSAEWLGNYLRRENHRFSYLWRDGIEAASSSVRYTAVGLSQCLSNHIPLNVQHLLL
jgi:hypothetical protein